MAETTDPYAALSQTIQRLIEVVNNIPDSIKAAMLSSAIGIGRNVSTFVAQGSRASGAVPAAAQAIGQTAFGAARVAGQSAAMAANTGAAGMAAAAGAASTALAGIGVVAVGAAKAIGAMQSATDSMTKRLLQYSPQVATIGAYSQMQQVFRDQRLGAQLAPEIAEYEKSRNLTADQFDAATKDFYKLFYKILSVIEKVELVVLKFTTWVMETFWPLIHGFVDTIGGFITAVLKWLEIVADNTKKDEKNLNATPAAEFIKRLAGGGLQNRKQKLAENKAVK